MVFAIPGAQPLEPDDDEPVALQVWLGTLNDQLFGVLTDPPTTLGGAPLTAESERLHHISGIQAVLIDDRLQSVSGLDPRAVVSTVFPELENRDFDDTTITVDGRPTSASTISYRGLDFAFARHYRHTPLVLVKLAGIGAWPAVSNIMHQ